MKRFSPIKWINVLLLIALLIQIYLNVFIYQHIHRWDGLQQQGPALITQPSDPITTHFLCTTLWAINIEGLLLIIIFILLNSHLVRRWLFDRQQTKTLSSKKDDRVYASTKDTPTFHKKTEGLPSPGLGIAELKNITAQRDKMQDAVTQILAQDSPSKEIIKKLIQVLGEGLGWDYGGMWLVVQTPPNTLRCVGVWQQPTLRDQAFLNVSLNSQFGLGRGLPGRAFEAQKPIWLMDMSKETSLSRSSVAKRVGLHSAMSIPIFSQNKIVAIMEFFTTQKLPLDETLLEWMLSIGRQIGNYLIQLKIDL